MSKLNDIQKFIITNYDPHHTNHFYDYKVYQAKNFDEYINALCEITSFDHDSREHVIQDIPSYTKSLIQYETSATNNAYGLIMFQNSKGSVSTVPDMGVMTFDARMMNTTKSVSNLPLYDAVNGKLDLSVWSEESLTVSQSTHEDAHEADPDLQNIEQKVKNVYGNDSNILMLLKIAVEIRSEGKAQLATLDVANDISEPMPTIKLSGSTDATTVFQTYQGYVKTGKAADIINLLAENQENNMPSGQSEKYIKSYSGKKIENITFSVNDDDTNNATFQMSSDCNFDFDSLIKTVNTAPDGSPLKNITVDKINGTITFNHIPHSLMHNESTKQLFSDQNKIDAEVEEGLIAGLNKGMDKMVAPSKANNILYAPSFSEDPIIISSDIENSIISINDINLYDYNKPGVSSATAWVSDGSYFLVTLDSKGQPVLIGNNTTSGFTVLKSYDTNGDGVINSGDTGFNQLYLWNGQNVGNVQSSDLQSLTTAGIQSISLTTATQNTDIIGSTLVSTATVTKTDGTTLTAGQFNFMTDPTYTVTDIDVALSSGQISSVINQVDSTGNTTTLDVSTLPNLHGYGNLSSLEATMIEDETITQKTITNTDGTKSVINETDFPLVDQIQNFDNLSISNISWNTILNDMKGIMNTWGSFQTATVTLPDGTSGPTQFIASNNNQKLDFLDNYFGQKLYFTGHETYVYYGIPSAQFIDNIYNSLAIDETARLALQGPYKELQTYFSFDETDDLLDTTDTDVNTFQSILTQYLSAYSPDYYNNQGSDTSTAFWNVVSSLFQTHVESIDSDNVTEFNDLKSVNTDLASYIVMTGQNIALDEQNNILNAIGNGVGGQTYIWNPDINMNISVSNGWIIDLMQSNYGIKNSDGTYSSGYGNIQPDSLVINANLSDLSVSINADDNIVFSYNSYQLVLQNSISVTQYIFNDTSIVQTANSSGTGYDEVATSDNATMIASDNNVVLDSAGYSATMYITGQNDSVNFSSSYSNVNIYEASDSFIINVGDNLFQQNISISVLSNGFLSITDGSATITIDDISNGYIQLQDNQGNKEYLSNGTYGTPTGTQERLLNSGSKLYASALVNNYDVNMTSGSATIYMEPSHVNGMQNYINFLSPTSLNTISSFEITPDANSTDAMVQFGNIQIKVMNAFYLDSNGNYQSNFDIRGVTDFTKESNNVALDPGYATFTGVQSNGIFQTSSFGTWNINTDRTTTDVELVDNVTVTVNISTNQNVFITSGASSRITVDDTGWNGQTLQSDVIFTENGSDIIATNSTTGNMISFLNATNNSQLSYFSIKSGYYMLSTNNISITWNQSGNSDITGDSVFGNIYNITGQSGVINNVTSNTMVSNVYNINGSGTFTINSVNTNAIKNTVYINNLQSNSILNDNSSMYNNQDTVYVEDKMSNVTTSIDTMGDVVIFDDGQSVFTIEHNFLWDTYGDLGSKVDYIRSSDGQSINLQNITTSIVMANGENYTQGSFNKETDVNMGQSNGGVNNTIYNGSNGTSYIYDYGGGNQVYNLCSSQNYISLMGSSSMTIHFKDTPNSMVSINGYYGQTIQSVVVNPDSDGYTSGDNVTITYSGKDYQGNSLLDTVNVQNAINHFTSGEDTNRLSDGYQIKEDYTSVNSGASVLAKDDGNTQKFIVQSNYASDTIDLTASAYNEILMDNSTNTSNSLVTDIVKIAANQSDNIYIDGATASQTMVLKNGNDLVIKDYVKGIALDIQNDFTLNSVNKIAFSDGTQISGSANIQDYATNMTSYIGGNIPDSTHSLSSFLTSDQNQTLNRFIQNS